jgi:RNA polymerase sigma-70 factor (ECF subfamily)
VNGPTDAELVERHLRGDGAAFDAIVDRYERRVYAVALRMCGEVEDARDVTQDVFVSALRSLKTFRSEAKLSTWLHRLAINASLDHLRRRRRRDARPLEDVHAVADPGLGPDERAADAERAAAVHRALAAVSPEHRAVVVLHDLQGLEYAEIADALGMALGTVKSRLHRARLELARLLGHLREEGEPTGGEGSLR